MGKKIDSNASLAELLELHPEMRDILDDNGYELENGDVEPADRVERIKEYIGRLSAGESLESVRADFVREFEGVDATEIAAAEQQLIEAGMPIAEVTQLCDVHSALFHGVAEEVDATEVGHPIHLLTLENEALESALARIEQTLAADGSAEDLLAQLNALGPLRTHYAKKNDLIFPLLLKYGISGPSDVMWNVQDEIMDELNRIKKVLRGGDIAGEKDALSTVLARVREMVFKESNILFPMAVEHFSLEEWVRIYRDFPEHGFAFIEDAPVWMRGESYDLPESEHYGTPSVADGDVKLTTGKLTLKQLEGIFRTIPAELTFADEDEVTRFVNEWEDRIFKRPFMALGRELYSCHPPRVKKMVSEVIKMLKTGQRDVFKVYQPIGDKQILVQYFAVRDEEGQYIGALEVVQDMTPYVKGTV